MGCNQGCFHNIYAPSTPGPFLEADRSSASLQDVRENPEAAHVTHSVCECFTGQVLSPAVVPGTEHPQTRRITFVRHLPKNLVWTDMQHWRHSPWDSCHQVKENNQQSHVLDHSPAFLIELILVWGERYEIPRGEFNLILNSTLRAGSPLHVPGDRLSSEYFSTSVFCEY
jgi:hypothetical protein